MPSLRFVRFRFEPVAGVLTSGGTTVRLRPKTAQLLAHFLDHAGSILSRNGILEEVWSDRIVTDNTLMQSVHELRVALGDSAAAPEFIETLHGRGYRWIGPRPSTRSSGSGRTMVTWPDLRVSLLVATVIAVCAAFYGLSRWNRHDPAEAMRTDLASAQKARSQGRSDLAQHYYEAALLREPSNPIAQAGLATVLYEIGDWAQAEAVSAAGIAAATGDGASNLAELHIVAGQIASGRGRLQQAEQHFLAARTQASSVAPLPVIYAAALSGLSQTYADQGRIVDYLSVRGEATDPLLMAAQLESYGEGLLSAGTTVRPAFDEGWSLARLEEALEVFEEIGDVTGMARSHAALGANRALSDAERGTHLQMALAHFRAYGHLPGELAALRTLASLETERFRAEAALEAVARGREIVEQLGARREAAALEYARGLALAASAVRKKEPDRTTRMAEAERAFSSAIEEYDQLGVVFDGIAPRLHQAIAEFESGSADKALSAFRDVAERYGALPFPPGELGARLGEAASLGALERGDQADAVLAELERRAPDASPVVAHLRTLLRSMPLVDRSGNPPSLFEIMITAQRVLADADAGTP